MEKINGLYNDLNDLAKEQDHKLDRLDCNIDDAFGAAKSANKQLRIAKPKSVCNMKLVFASITLAMIVCYFLSSYFNPSVPATKS